MNSYIKSPDFNYHLKNFIRLYKGEIRFLLICGEWGAGKTLLINKCVEELPMKDISLSMRNLKGVSTLNEAYFMLLPKKVRCTIEAFPFILLLIMILASVKTFLATDANDTSLSIVIGIVSGIVAITSFSLIPNNYKYLFELIEKTLDFDIFSNNFLVIEDIDRTSLKQSEIDSFLLWIPTFRKTIVTVGVENPKRLQGVVELIAKKSDELDSSIIEVKPSLSAKLGVLKNTLGALFIRNPFIVLNESCIWLDLFTPREIVDFCRRSNTFDNICNRENMLINKIIRLIVTKCGENWEDVIESVSFEKKKIRFQPYDKKWNTPRFRMIIQSFIENLNYDFPTDSTDGERTTLIRNLLSLEEVS